ncbi:MAG TPA: ABC transporter substrate-binding protein [Candidatus Acidoferrales bacterium]|nr:ABC transporter substrate-binding protein [Candidatus Acidoferrales bacterium]
MNARARALAIASVFLFTLGALRAQAQPAPFEINVMISMSGAAAFLGKEQVETYTILEKVVNRSGGIAGRPVKFVFHDDQSSPQVGLQLVNEMISRKVPVIIGSSFAAVCNAVAPLVKNNGPVLYCLSPGIHPAPGGYVFASSVSTRDIAAVMLRYLRERKWNRIAIITTTDQSGQDFETAFNAGLTVRENAALQVVEREHFAPGDISVGAQMARIKAGNPQALFAWGVGTPFGTLLQGITESGIQVPTLSSNGNMISAQLSQYARYIPDQLYFPGTTVLARGQTRPGPMRDKQAAFYDAFDRAGIKPDNPNNTAWDPANLIVDAFRRLGTSATAQQIRDFIRDQHGWVGINGVYDYADAEQRGIGGYAIVIYRYDAKAGAFIPSSRPGGTLR